MWGLCLPRPSGGPPLHPIYGLLSNWSGVYDPNAASILDTETLTSVNVTLPGLFSRHVDLTPDGRFGFVAVWGSPPGVAVVNIEEATLRAFYPIPGPGFVVHGVRYAPGPS